MNKMSDDEMIAYKRLIYNGQTGDDDRLNFLVKLIIEWAKLDKSDVSGKRYSDKIMCLLATAETESKKSHLQFERMNKNRILYNCIYQQFQIEIKRVDVIMSKCKENVECFNKEFKLFKDTYLPLLKELGMYPSLNESLERMHVIQEQIVNFDSVYQRMLKQYRLISIYVRKIRLARTRLKVITRDLSNVMQESSI